MDKAEGKAKEAFGALIGDEAKKAEGRAQQRKAEAEKEAEQREKTRPRPRRPSGNETSKSSRTRACWAAWATHYQNFREAAVRAPAAAKPNQAIALSVIAIDECGYGRHDSRKSGTRAERC
jgi:hypothetical protein